MNDWKKAVLLAGICSGTLFMGVLPAQAADKQVSAGSQQQQGIQSVSVITKVYGDGEKPAYAVLKYPQPVAPGISPAAFKVAGQTVAAVSVNRNPEPTAKSVAGRYVVLELAHTNTVYDGDLSRQPGHHQEEKKPGQGTDAPRDSNRKLPDLSVRVQQTGEVRAVNGTIYAANEREIASTAAAEPEISRFKQFTYTDPTTGYKMPYNLYLPANYDAHKKYPLVFFVADASANINEVKTPLFQGNGATVWTDPAEQAKHECIVLAPQYTKDLVNQIGMMTTDENKWTPGLTLISNLLFDVMKQYSVDTDRIYGTGQSQGGMTNIALSDKYPDLFAGQLLVACQWNVEEMAAMKDKNLWIVVCEGDTKAYPGMNAATASWEKLGSKVVRNKVLWDSKSSIAALDVQVKGMEAQGAKINYSVFQGGNHMYTWSFAYNIDALRDWLFRQNKSAVPGKFHRDPATRALLDKGIGYLNGTGEAKDYAKARHYFELADQRGDFKASRYLGLIYEHGYGVKADMKTAVRWYQKAANAGDITGTCYLGHMYEAGLGVVQDYQQALRLYLKSAERGDSIAAPGMVAAANLYRNGYGTVKDEAIARQWLEKAAATGYQPAVDALK